MPVRLLASVLSASAALCGGCHLINMAPQEKFDPQTASVWPTPGPITIDGSLDDPAWSSAPEYEMMANHDPLADVGPYKTTVRLLYDATRLYIAFRCSDPHVWSTFARHDEHLYREEVVEAFLCPSGNLKENYELQASPFGVTFDAKIGNRKGDGGTAKDLIGPDFAWTCTGFQAKAAIVAGTGNRARAGTAKAEGWTVEMAIPFASIPGGPHTPPQPGDVWRAGLYRIERPAEGPDLYLAFSPTLTRPANRPDFHRPGRFGTLWFR